MSAAHSSAGHGAHATCAEAAVSESAQPVRPPSRVARALRTAAVAPIRVYQRWISPGLPAHCKYHPSCSEYAVQAVSRYGILRGAVLAAWRLLRCNPWSHGGVDFVEDQTLFRSPPRA